MTLLFDYARLRETGDELIARGGQVVASMRRQGDAMEPVPIPVDLREALRPYAPS